MPNLADLTFSVTHPRFEAADIGQTGISFYLHLKMYNALMTCEHSCIIECIVVYEDLNFGDKATSA